ncbi:ribonuclease P protein component [Peptoniphilus sp. MSJ-1]|uniref:Ribonuclease P protein component n=1 Tax=Peptoniphilus ovalis TaxID=2841503 RepID=A0ABS6FE52_9FIRM|nr:ribonuclease P protein component [Peptoniphilus ovalis]MBU5668468.1 ribonuclease P protein component [Peptoniphilus ovalis]
MKDCYLKKNSEFQRVYAKKNISGSRYITLFTAKNSFNYPRCGITTTKKIGNAVKRNFVKRRLKHIIRENSDKLSNGMDYVFVVKKDAPEADFKDFKNSFFSVLKRQKKVKR